MKYKIRDTGNRVRMELFPVLGSDIMKDELALIEYNAYLSNELPDGFFDRNPIINKCLEAK